MELLPKLRKAKIISNTLYFVSLGILVLTMILTFALQFEWVVWPAIVLSVGGITTLIIGDLYALKAPYSSLNNFILKSSWVLILVYLITLGAAIVDFVLQWEQSTGKA